MAHALYPQLDHCCVDFRAYISIDESLSPGPCLGNVECEVLRVARMSMIMEIGNPVRAFDDDECLFFLLSYDCVLFSC